MSTSRTCTTPKEAWELCSHYLANLLPLIEMKNWDTGEESKEKKGKQERSILDLEAQLTGHLYMIMRQMLIYGYHEDAAKMQQLVDMTVELDLTDPAVCEAINAKHGELDANRREFETYLKTLKGKNL